MPSNKKTRSRERTQLKQSIDGGTNSYNVRSIHVRQSFNWDCGLACAEMAMKCANQSEISTIKPDSTPLTPFTHGEPLWTIELYMGMRQRGFNVEMSTSVKGVNTNHINIDFYKKTVGADIDTVARINDKFKDVDAMGWDVLDAIPTSALPDLLHDKSTLCAVVLVNWYVIASRNMLYPEFFGHCILLTGYDNSTSRFTYLDPLLGPATKSVCKNVFDAARVYPGTDMDMIVVHPTTIYKEL